MTEMLEPAPIFVRRALVLRLLADAQQSPERRVCGLLSGQGDQAERLWPLRNLAADPLAAVSVDPEACAAVRSAMAARGQTLWGSFHSCPLGAQAPSDLEVPGLDVPRRLVAALDIRGVLQLRGFVGGRECELKLGG